MRGKRLGLLTSPVRCNHWTCFCMDWRGQYLLANRNCHGRAMALPWSRPHIAQPERACSGCKPPRAWPTRVALLCVADIRHRNGGRNEHSHNGTRRPEIRRLEEWRQKGPFACQGCPVSTTFGASQPINRIVSLGRRHHFGLGRFAF
jgi:hypothetical protein